MCTGLRRSTLRSLCLTKISLRNGQVQRLIFTVGSSSFRLFVPSTLPCDLVHAPLSFFSGSPGSDSTVNQPPDRLTLDEPPADLRPIDGHVDDHGRGNPVGTRDSAFEARCTRFKHRALHLARCGAEQYDAVRGTPGYSVTPGSSRCVLRTGEWRCLALGWWPPALWLVDSLLTRACQRVSDFKWGWSSSPWL